MTLAVTVIGTAGCDLSKMIPPPEARFVSSERADDVSPKAKKFVVSVVDEQFGSPMDLVAWKRLPVDFGEITGKVVSVEVDEDGSSDQLTVELSLEDGAESPGLTSQGIVWTSGEYTQGAIKAELGKKEKVGLVGIQIDSFDVEDGTLILSHKMSSPPKEGDTFAVVGSQFQAGRHLYARHCLHCHGVTGDGNGPTAQYLNPRPRDYRLGVFKFVSVIKQDRATHDDLTRIVKHGVPGTYMPSFMLMDDNEVQAIVEYIRWLAMRGELENQYFIDLETDFSKSNISSRVDSSDDKRAERDLIEEEFKDYITNLFDAKSIYDRVLKPWERSRDEETAIFPELARIEDSIESRARGRKIFMGKAGCATCHGDAGRGNGPKTEQYEPRKSGGGTWDEPGLHDDWGNIVRPRNLTTGIYRGGRRPLDIYRRIAAGISGTPMAGFKATMKDDQIWDLVNYVYSIPFEKPSESSDEKKDDDKEETEDVASSEASPERSAAR